MASVYESILTAAQSVLAVLPWDGGLTADAIKVRALPHVGEQLDTLPCMLLCPYGPYRAGPGGSFENTQDRVYGVEVALIAASNRDMQSGLGQYLSWHQQAVRALAATKLDGVSSVWTSTVDASPVVDRAKFNQQYGYLSLVAWFTSHDPRT